MIPTGNFEKDLQAAIKETCEEMKDEWRAQMDATYEAYKKTDCHKEAMQCKTAEDLMRHRKKYFPEDFTEDGVLIVR